METKFSLIPVVEPNTYLDRKLLILQIRSIYGQRFFSEDTRGEVWVKCLICVNNECAGPKFESWTCNFCKDIMSLLLILSKVIYCDRRWSSIFNDFFKRDVFYFNFPHLDTHFVNCYLSVSFNFFQSKWYQEVIKCIPY